MVWMLLTLAYGVIKGIREIVKKKSLETSGVMEVLFFYTLFGFLFLLAETALEPGGFHGIQGVEARSMGMIAVKSFVIFIAWICGFKAIAKIPVSLYGILDLSRVIFSMLLGVVVLRETLSPTGIIGLVLVAAGLLMLKLKKSSEPEEAKAVFVLLAFISSLLNAVSGTMDKILTREVTSAQLQFWYMLFLTLFYGIYLIFCKEKVQIMRALKNYWIWILSFLFIVADRALFMANAIPDSRVTVMTLIKQSCCIVTILAGKFLFKEKGIAYKLLCAGIVIAGIVIGAL